MVSRQLYLQIFFRKYFRLLIVLAMCIVSTFYLSLYFRNNNLQLPITSQSGSQQYDKRSGLVFKDRKFYLNNEEIYILSGSIHYFRVMPDQWYDRLYKLKAAGLNTVDTYVPWNLHEEIKGSFNFEDILNVRKFVQTAHQIGLHVVLRPGPYICAEWEFGGLPSWLLSDPNMKVRSMYFGYIKAVEEYFRQLLFEIADLQYTRGGPVIAFQIENEYSSYGNSQPYMLALKSIMQKYGVVETMFVSNGDQTYDKIFPIPDAFLGVNFNDLSVGEKLISFNNQLNKDNPIFITEFWTGWFLIWGAIKSQARNDLIEVLETFLTHRYHINFYMFHGGTNFGFMNGAHSGGFDITSYDYEAPITESGQLTEKYMAIRKTIFKHMPPEYVAKVPDVPKVEPAYEYGIVNIEQFMPYTSILKLIEEPHTSDNLIYMENLPINWGSGQGYGFILYRSVIKPAQKLRIIETVRDRGQVFINNQLLRANEKFYGTFDSFSQMPLSLDLSESKLEQTTNVLDILVENMGRVNWVDYQSNLINEQRKGLTGKVFTDNSEVQSWKIYALEFKKAFMQKLSTSDKWEAFKKDLRPAVYRGYLKLNGGTPKDTWIDMTNWTKGIVFVNGFNLGRYWFKGPQKRLYLPKALLKVDKNEILIFELHEAHSSVNMLSDGRIKFH